jgi:hypothetical protein
MFEIWRHIATGRRYLVVCRDGRATAAAGPLREIEDPIHILEAHGNPSRNPHALLEMRKSPQNYVREYVQDRRGDVTRYPRPQTRANGGPALAWTHDGAGRMYVMRAVDFERLRAGRVTLAQLLREGLAEEVVHGGEEALPGAHERALRESGGEGAPRPG